MSDHTFEPFFTASVDSSHGHAGSECWPREVDRSWNRAAAAAKSVQPESAATLDWHRFIDWLPRLGTPLWLHRTRPDTVFPRARLLPQGVLLLDHPALAAFADCRQVTAQGLVGAQGPREWLEFADARGVCIARLYLLPDTDYLAWDGMLADCGIQRVESREPQRWQAHAAFMRGALSRLRSTWQAQAMRFPVLRLPCLQVLGLRAPDSFSVLGRQLASAIANDERAVLQSASG
jgi:hypothetical protein